MDNKLDDIKDRLEKARHLVKDELDDKIRAKLREHIGKLSGAQIGDHLRDIDESIPANQRSNMKNAVKQQNKSKLQVVKEEDFTTEQPAVTKANMYGGYSDCGETLKCDSNGQWKLTKDNSVKPFGENIYDSKANLGRKATRTGEVREGVGRNQAVRNYTTSNSSIQGAHEAAEQKRRAKNPAPVKHITLSPEERAAYETKANLKRSEGLHKALGWTYNQDTGNFNHPLHGSVKIRENENPNRGYEVVHNGKILSTHPRNDRMEAINRAAVHMKDLSTASGDANVNKEEVSENSDKFGAGED